MQRQTTFDTLCDWLVAAQGPADPATAAALLPLLTGSRFLCQARVSDLADDRGHTFVAFQPPAPKDRESLRQPRQIKTIYAAITRSLELAGGNVSYDVNPLPKSGGGEKFQLKVRLKNASKKAKTFTLSRLLFMTDKSGGGALCEFPGQHRIIAPDAFWFQPRNGRDALLTLIRDGLGNAASDLLKDMFATADKWHRDELAAMMARRGRQE